MTRVGLTRISEKIRNCLKRKKGLGHQSGTKLTRPSWDDTFLSIAHQISKRSHDIQTQCGAVIVDDKHRIIGVGYNGFIRGIDDRKLPNTRPLKYPFMIHAELNAILNCQHRPEQCTMYVTGPPCLHCLQCAYQSGISKIIYDKNHKIHMLEDDEYACNFRLITSMISMQIIPVDYKGA